MTNKLQSTTKIVVFEPLETQVKWLEAAVQLMTTNKTAVSEKCGVHRTRWYDWIKQPGFREWFFSEYKKMREVIIPELDEIGMKFARKGSIEHWKIMREAVEGEVKASGVKKRIVAEEFFE